MKTGLISCSVSKVSLGLAATVLLIQINPAAAQKSEDVLEEIVVETPAIVSHDEKIGREQFEVWELRRSVSYSDLDLRLHKDVAELKGRIEIAAQEVCKELADQNPKLRDSEPACIRKAVTSATEKMDVIVSATN